MVTLGFGVSRSSSTLPDDPINPSGNEGGQILGLLTGNGAHLFTQFQDLIFRKVGGFIDHEVIDFTVFHQQPATAGCAILPPSTAPFGAQIRE